MPVLVEGPLDAIAVTEGTDGRCVGLAACGTAISDDHVAQLARFSGSGTSPDLVLALDGDDAGRAAAERLLAVLSCRGLSALVPSGTGGLDPAALLHQHGAAALTSALLDTARPLADVVIDTRLRAWGDRTQWVEGQVGALRSVAPLVAVLPPAERHRLTHEVAVRTSLSPVTVQREVAACITGEGVGASRGHPETAPVPLSPSAPNRVRCVRHRR